MASFLARTAGLGGNAPVVNAKTAETAANAANADKLGGFASNGLVRVASNNSSGSTTLNGNPGDVVTVTIVAPTAGFVIVNGSVSLQGSTSSAATIYIVADGGAASSPDLRTSIGLGNVFESVSPAYVFPVGTGTHTFTLTVRATGSAGDATLNAIFVPFGYNGGNTLVPAP